jgi:glyoxylase I family protein
MGSGVKAEVLRPDAVPFGIKALDHVVLRYRDVALGARFYCDVLGCTVEKARPEIGLTQLRAGTSLIDLIDMASEVGRAGGAAPGKEARNLDHFCLRVEPWDAPAIARHLAAHGVEAGEVASRFGADGQGPSIYLYDPEGNQVELKGPPEV